MTIIDPHGFVPAQDDAQSCDICSGVPGDPIHRVGAGPRDGWSPRDSETPRQRPPGKPKGRVAKRSILLAVGGIAVVAIAAGYFLSDSQTSNDSNQPLTAASVTSASPEPTTTPSRGAPEWITALEIDVHQLVNVQRQQNALPNLSQDPKLAAIARAHSKDMALNNFFEHENLAGETAADRGNAVGYRCLKDFGNFYTEGISENIFQGWYYSSINSRGRNYMTIEELAIRIVEDWMNSPGHRENIMTDTYDREGIGVVIGAEESVWVTQNFC